MGEQFITQTFGGSSWENGRVAEWLNKLVRPRDVKVIVVPTPPSGYKVLVLVWFEDLPGELCD